jgi:hypothetical protein
VSKPSKQLACQRRYIAAGLCRSCGKEPIIKSGLGQLCLDKNRIACRNRYRLKHGIPLDTPLWKRTTLPAKVVNAILEYENNLTVAPT